MLRDLDLLVRNLSDDIRNDNGVIDTVNNQIGSIQPLSDTPSIHMISMSNGNHYTMDADKFQLRFNLKQHGFKVNVHNLFTIQSIVNTYMKEGNVIAQVSIEDEFNQEFRPRDLYADVDENGLVVIQGQQDFEHPEITLKYSILLMKTLFNNLDTVGMIAPLFNK